jgi:hypothetical protein
MTNLMHEGGPGGVYGDRGEGVVAHVTWAIIEEVDGRPAGSLHTAYHLWGHQRRGTAP